MLTYLRKNMKGIMVVVAFLFAFSMLYGLGYTGLQQMTQRKEVSFIRVNGKEIDPAWYNNIFMRIRENMPETVSPEELLFIQNLALSQTIDFAIMLEEARKRTRISGQELDQTIEQIARQQNFNNVHALRRAVEAGGRKWNDFRRMIRDEMLVQKRVSEIKGAVQATRDDLREVRASHILIVPKNEPDGDSKARALADELKERAVKGGDFASLAREYSEDPGSKARGGDLGFFGTGRMVKKFEETAFSAKVGEIVGPVKTDFGYHVIKVTDARLKSIPGAADIEAAVREQKQDAAFNEWFYGLKQKANVEIIDTHLRALDLRFKGKINEAIEEYQQAIRENPGDPYLRLSLGILFEETGRVKQAILYYKEAVKLQPADPNMYIILGKAHLNDGSKDLAAEQFQMASLIAGDNKALHRELEKIYTDMGRSDLARKERAEIIRIEKKQAFEQGLKDEGSKIRTE